MPGKEFKLMGKTMHPDGYYTVSSIISTSHEAISDSEAAAAAAAATVLPKRPHIKLWFHKGIFIGPEQREKLIREEEQEEEQELQAAAASAAAIAKKEIIPTPGFVLLVKESVEEAKTTTTAAVSSTTNHHPISDDYSSSSISSSTFQSKLDATKRKMHDSYQQLANAKKQRRIQVIDPRDLPPPPIQSSSKGKGATARKKMIITTTNRKTRNFFDGRGSSGRPSKLVKPTTTSIF